MSSHESADVESHSRQRRYRSRAAEYASIASAEFNEQPMPLRAARRGRRRAAAGVDYQRIWPARLRLCRRHDGREKSIFRATLRPAPRCAARQRPSAHATLSPTPSGEIRIY